MASDADIRSLLPSERSGYSDEFEEHQQQQRHGIVSPRGDGDIAHDLMTKRILHVIHEGVRSLLDLDFSAHDVKPSMLLNLSLHSNRVSSLEGLSSMTVRMRKVQPYDGNTIHACLAM